MTPVEVEEFWDDLLPFIEQRRVIPVLGAELLTIQEGSATRPLYRAVADRLLARHGLPELPLAHYGLHEAVSALAASGRRVRDLYRPVHDILQKLVAEHPEALAPLRELAAIRHFDLFVTTTPDDLLARALNAVRFDGTPRAEEIEYAPKLPTERHRDIPEAPSSGYAAVFYLFGRADVSPFFAIHEEDALEFPYMLQTGSGPERMFSQMRSRNLLLIGCTFGDWLNRFFLRLSNTDRLSSDQRMKKEYLVGEETVRDRDFVVFLERFSLDSRCLSMDARAFVSELHRRWCDRNADAPVVPARPSAVPSSGGAVFISYASDDIGAARTLCEELQRMSGDVAWFDKSALMPGDRWDEHIRGAIQKCSLFVPLISSNTEQRTEGYFRLEWSEAAERSRRIEGRKFIFPVVVDPDYGGDPSRYVLLPERFRSFQYSHAPRGQMNDRLRQELQVELRNLRRGKPA